MSAVATKAVLAVGTLSAMAVFYDQAITTAEGLVQKTRTAMAAAELAQYDRRLVARWDMYGAPPRDIKKALRSEFDSGGGKDILTDYWGNPYVLESRKDGYLLLSLGADGRRDTTDDVLIRRQGREVETQLDWVDSPEELIAPMQELTEKQARIVERSASQPEADIDEIELEIQAAVREFRAADTSGFIESGEVRAAE